MKASLAWQPQAREDLLRLYLDIGMENPAAAEQLYDALETRAAALARFPRLGVRRPDIGRAVRVLIEGAYLILYETRPDTDDGPIESAEVIRVVDGRRDLTHPF